MPLCTITNYQYRYGTSMTQVAEKLNGPDDRG